VVLQLRGARHENSISMKRIGSFEKNFAFRQNKKTQIVQKNPVPAHEYVCEYLCACSCMYL